MSEQQQTLTLQQALDLAVEHHSAGRLSDAENIYQKILQADPNQPVASHLLGVIAHQKGKHDIAVNLISKALKLKPDYAEAHSNIGLTLQELGRSEDAIAHYQKAIDLKPGYAEAHNNLGYAVQGLGRREAAVASYQKALKIKPTYALAYYNQGNALQELLRLEEAVTCYQEALNLEPNYAEAYSNLGATFQKLGKLDEAISSYRKALSLKPDYSEARSNFLFTLLSSTVDLQTLFEEHCLWEKKHKVQQQRILHKPRGDPQKRLHVGFVSADFRDHNVSYFLESPFSSFDQKKMAIYCYSNSYVEDARTVLFQSLIEKWRNIAGWEDAKVVDLIQSDEIDILVDLSGHTRGHRLSVFASKPAPIQFTWLGYPGMTTGLTAIDYRLTDDIADPPGIAEKYCVEQLIRLPNGHHCYRPHGAAPEIGLVPMATNPIVTFASFNTLSKVTPEVADSWIRILQAVPQSRLFLKNWHWTSPSSRQRYLSLFSNSIDPKRIVFKPWASSKRSHLAMYNEVDIALDTFPFNGITTTCEALWMGVPVVTWYGDRYSSRVGASLLSRVGLRELAPQSVDGYIETAVALAQNPKRLGQFRLEMRNRLQTSSLCDGVAFARDLESTFRRAWRDLVSTTGTGPSQSVMG